MYVQRRENSKGIARADVVVEPLDIVVDVGGVYSPEKHRYDHHQRGFTEVFGSGGFDKTKLSSAGLVYKYVSPRVYGMGSS